MSEELVIGVIVVTWVAIGLTLSVVMGRRGHDAWAWMVLGTLLGPLAIALAIDERRHRYAEGVRSVLRPGVAGAGSLDVLVGADGSAESGAALEGVRHLLSGCLGRVTVATVVPFDASPETEKLAAAAVERQVGAADDDRLRVEVLRGKPADALTAAGTEGDYDLIVIGTRGHGRTRAVFGSVATQLSRGGGFPVLMFSAGTGRSRVR
jgi:nucleotide-binding universal stress UspA family protein